MESLENRFMLSHPAVAAVNVTGTNWASNFVSYIESLGLGSGGYAIPAGVNQLQTLPWNNIDQIRVTFTEDVVVEAADLSISGVNTTAYAFSEFSYDSNTYTATWTLGAPIAKDKLMLDLDADGMDPICSAATGEVLDGAWTDGQGTFPSGDTEGGTDFQFRFNVLPGDVNGSTNVNGTDVVYINLRANKVIGDATYGIRYDLDGNGQIGANDYSFATTQVGAMLPTGNPVGMTNDAPTTSGIGGLSIAKGTADYVLTLTDFFDDAETLPEDLVYSVVNNSNASLFDSLDFDSGELALDFASDIAGDAVLTLRATDSAGLFVETTVEVHVSAAPVISNFYCINEIADIWTLTGVVTDSDDPVVDNIVTFGGVLASYNLTATVREDGVFSLTVELIGLQMGGGTAQTTDPNGVLSNLAEYWVIA